VTSDPLDRPWAMVCSQSLLATPLFMRPSRPNPRKHFLSLAHWGCLGLSRVTSGLFFQVLLFIRKLTRVRIRVLCSKGGESLINDLTAMFSAQSTPSLAEASPVPKHRGGGVLRAVTCHKFYIFKHQGGSLLTPPPNKGPPSLFRKEVHPGPPKKRPK